MVIEEEILPAITLSEYIDYNLVIRIGQAHPFDCPLRSAGQISLHILELFNICEIWLSVYDRLVALLKALPLLDLTVEDSYLKLWQGDVYTLCSGPTMSWEDLADKLRVSSSSDVARHVGNLRQPLRVAIHDSSANRHARSALTKTC